MFDKILYLDVDVLEKYNMLPIHCLTKQEKALQYAISAFYFLTVTYTSIVLSHFTQIFLVFSSSIEYISSQVSMKEKGENK